MEQGSSFTTVSSYYRVSWKVLPQRPPGGQYPQLSLSLEMWSGCHLAAQDRMSPLLCLWSPLSFKGSVSFCRGHRTTDRRVGESLRDSPVQLHCFRLKTQGMMGLAQHNKWKYQCLWSCASGSSGLVTASTKFGHYWKHISKCRNAANGGAVAHRMISVLHKDLAFLRQSGPPHHIPTGRGGFSSEV